MKQSEEFNTIEKLALKALTSLGSHSQDLERSCWLVVHEFKHGVMPSEYDIREIDEDLYLSVLSLARKKIKVI